MAMIGISWWNTHTEQLMPKIIEFTASTPPPPPSNIFLDRWWQWRQHKHRNFARMSKEIKIYTNCSCPYFNGNQEQRQPQKHIEEENNHERIEARNYKSVGPMAPRWWLVEESRVKGIRQRFFASVIRAASQISSLTSTPTQTLITLLLMRWRM